MEDNEEEDCDNHFPIHAGFGAFDEDTIMEEPEEEVAEDYRTNNLGQALCGAQEDCESEKERMKLQQCQRTTALYLGCEDGVKKLDTTLELLQWKATHGVSDKGFGVLLFFLKTS